MSGFLVDTNVLSETVKPTLDRNVEAWIVEHPPNTLFTAATVIAEISFGIELMPESRRRRVLERWLEELVDVQFAGRILPFNEAAALAHGRLGMLAQRSGRRAQVADTQIAAVASIHGLTVATRDTADFAGFGVPLVNPFEAA